YLPHDSTQRAFVEGIEIELDDGRERQQGRPRIIGREVVERDPVSSTRERFDFRGNAVIAGKVLEEFEDDAVRRQGPADTGKQDVAGEIDEGVAVRDERIEAELQEGIEGDLGRRGVAVGNGGSLLIA